MKNVSKALLTNPAIHPNVKDLKLSYPFPVLVSLRLGKDYLYLICKENFIF